MGELVNISKKLMRGDDGCLVFECPGCNIWHQVMTGNGDGPRWGWNGSAEKPTFTPSILVRWDHWTPPATTLEISAKIRSGEIVQTKVSDVCHSFVTDGRIQFLSDCTHSLAGQTVDIPDLEDE